MWWFLFKFWKEIAIVMIIVSAMGATYGFVKHYEGLKNSERELKGQITILKEDVKEFDETIKGLGLEMEENRQDVNRYIRTIKRLQVITNEIQSKYNILLEKINNVKLPLNTDGTLSEPVILIHPGLPTEYLELKAASGDSNKGNP